MFASRRLTVLLLLIAAFGAAAGLYGQRHSAPIISGETIVTETLSEEVPAEPVEPVESIKPVESAAAGFTSASYPAASEAEKAVVASVNDFERAIFDRSEPQLVSLLTVEAAAFWRPEYLTPAYPYPIKFSFDYLEVRTDTTALVSVTETVRNAAGEQSQRERFLELIPAENGHYLVVRYFTFDNEAPLAGF